MHVQTQPSFNIGPKLFNGIQVGRIGRKKHDLKPIFIRNIENCILSMKRSIIQNQYTFRGVFKRWNKDVFKPSFKQVTIHCSAKRKRGYNLAAVLCCDNAGSGKMSATYFSNHLFPARSISIFPRIVFIKTAFIRIIQFAVFWQCLYFGDELFPFFFVAFSVFSCVFLRVIPRTFLALRTPETLQ